MDNNKQDYLENSTHQNNNSHLKGPGQNQPGGTPGADAPRGPNLFNIILIFFLVTFFLNAFVFNQLPATVTQIGYSQFIELVENGSVSQAQLTDEQIQIVTAKDADLAEVERILYPDGRDSTQAAPEAGGRYIAVRVEDPDLVARLHEHGVSFDKQYTSTNSSPITNFIAMWVIPTFLMYLIYFF